MKHHLIVYVPVSHAPAIREVLGRSGAGHIGNYDHCSFSMHGTGRFRPLKGADPHIGTVGEIAEVDEERIEAVVTSQTNIPELLKNIRSIHPYEEPAIHILPMLNEEQLN